MELPGPLAIIHSMRTIVLLLMIALLPLRLWAADGMAVRMAQAEVAAAGASSAAMPEDCPMMVQGGQSGTMDHGDGGEAKPTHCVACYLCAAAASVPQARLEAGPAPAGPAVRGAARFRSAEITPDLRPPIS